MTEAVALIAWDTCVVLDAIKADPMWWPQLQPVYDDAEEGKIRILVSEVTVAEACKLSKDNNDDVEAAVRKIGEFFDNPFIARRPVDQRVSEKAAQIIRDHTVKTCDALILATAIIHGAKVLYTHDGLKKSGRKTNLLRLDDKVGIPIEPPDAAKYKGWDLFAQSNNDE